ncbi:hypothetical protein FA10DRAFT_302014 [Acaromyces ingoldii]|uniref:Uncharacterized protein n=1 Tax=Acaromyces ingoldii TaxID=215250 RepID=A0A316YQ74_9BASI|nr:hypothetical protein FA10DRAFT_302014 [Acaromyces ingoldii]PWN90818.1 hypothetical protein FA10DRAFT_302014 [Acaromyces ingoldii]
MRFSFAAVSLFALAGLVAAVPVEKRSVVTEIGSLISGLEDGLGVTALEDELDKLLGGGLSKLEETLGVTFAEKLLKLSKEGASPGDLQTIGKGIYYLEEGLGVNAVDDFLDKETGGAITSIEKALGVTDIEKALGIEA